MFSCDNWSNWICYCSTKQDKYFLYNTLLYNTLIINVWLLHKKRNLTQKISKVVTNILSTLLVKVSSIMERTTNFYLCIRVTFLRKKSIKAQTGETSCDFRLDLSRLINFLSAFVRFLRFFTWSSYFCDNFDEPWSSSCFFHWDEFCLPREIEFISSLLSIKLPKFWYKILMYLFASLS